MAAVAGAGFAAAGVSGSDFEVVIGFEPAAADAFAGADAFEFAVAFLCVLCCSVALRESFVVALVFIAAQFSAPLLRQRKPDRSHSAATR